MESEGDEEAGKLARKSNDRRGERKAAQGKTQEVVITTYLLYVNT